MISPKISDSSFKEKNCNMAFIFIVLATAFIYFNNTVFSKMNTKIWEHIITTAKSDKARLSEWSTKLNKSTV